MFVDAGKHAEVGTVGREFRIAAGDGAEQSSRDRRMGDVIGQSLQSDFVVVGAAAVGGADENVEEGGGGVRQVGHSNPSIHSDPLLSPIRAHQLQQKKMGRVHHR